MMPTTPATDRHGLEVLDLAQSLSLLESVPVGRVAFSDGGAITILPVNHLVNGTTVVFRTASGAKFDTAIMRRPMAFEVDHWDGDDHAGWSVLIRGRADLVEDEALVALLEARGLRSWVDTRHDRSWVQIRADEVTGRRLLAS